MDTTIALNLEAELLNRACVVARALANLRARGVEPRPEVRALYARYARGELSRSEVQAEMSGRSERLQAGLGEEATKRSWAGAPAAGAPGPLETTAAAARPENAAAAAG